jgi:galactokinase
MQKSKEEHMATDRQLKEQIMAGKQDKMLRALYGTQEEILQQQRARYVEALECFAQYYGGGREVRLYSAPGRTELGGNHTDHQHGFGLAAAVDLDLVAVVARSDDAYIRVKSRGFNKLDVVDLDERTPQAEESTHSAGLIRGIVEGFRARGVELHGMDIYTTSNVMRGSGLSSSAAFETAIGTILNHELNDARFSPVEVALMAHYAENTYFGKPSGLLDPLTSALGGVVFADFADPAAPKTQKIHAQGILPQNIALCVTDTRGSHSELMEEFAAIRTEMEAIAICFGKKYLGEVAEEDFWAQVPALRVRCGDRAVLRAVHFYQENARVPAQKQALESKNFAEFLRLVQQCGHSSFEYCQNVFCADTPTQQSLSIALAISQKVLAGSNAAWRMQGGGFAGTIQAFVPLDKLAEYQAAMDAVFSAGSCHVVHLREQGGVRLL